MPYRELLHQKFFKFTGTAPLQNCFRFDTQLVHLRKYCAATPSWSYSAATSKFNPNENYLPIGQNEHSTIY